MRLDVVGAGVAVRAQRCVSDTHGRRTHDAARPALKSVTQAGVSQRLIADETDYRKTLAEVFRLDIPETDYLWRRILARDEIRASEAAHQ